MNVLLVMSAHAVGARSCTSNTWSRRWPVNAVSPVALSDHPALCKLAARLSQCAEVVSFPLAAPARLPGAMRKLIRLGAAHDVVHLNSNHPASRLGILMGVALPASGKPVVGNRTVATQSAMSKCPAASCGPCQHSSGGRDGGKARWLLSPRKTNAR